jgi:hypothetical protein
LPELNEVREKEEMVREVKRELRKIQRVFG